jgi:hypothetical protein
MNTRWMYVLMDEPPADGGAGGQGGAGGEPSWYDSFQNQEVKDWLKSYDKAYPNPEAVAIKALNLERFVGAEKSGRGIVTPKPDAKPEEWQEFYKKVGGVPEKPEGYKLPDAMITDQMAQNFREYAHKIGMPPMFFDAALNWYNEQMEGGEKKFMAELEAQSEKDFTELKQEWAGVEYDKNVELGRRAAEKFIPHANREELADTMTKIEGALGTKATMKLWASIGAALGEDHFEGGQGTGGGGGMSPEGAKVRIAELKRDIAWQGRFSSGDLEAKTEWERLHKIAYGG